MRRQQGYTLLELLVVVGIVGLLSAIVMPRVGDSLTALQHYAAARQLLADAHFVRQKSIVEKVAWKIEFFPDNGFYRVLRDTTEVREMRRHMPRNIRLTHNSPSGFWMFNNMGEAANSFSTVTLATPNGDRLYVVLAASGRLRLSSTPPGV